MIKYIIFDWGGVFTHGHLIKDFSHNLSKKCGKTKEEIEKIFRDLEYPYETGKVVPESFWKEFREKLGIEISHGEIQKIFLNSYDINFPMLELAKELKKKYKLILLTNNYEDMFGFIRRKYNLDEYFDYLYSSADIKDKKPNREIYQYVINQLKIDPQEAFFIDDKEKNIIGARETSLNAIKFEGIENLKIDLAKLIK